MGGRKDHEQEKGMRKRQVLGTMEGMYHRRRYMGKQGKLEECDGIGRGFQKEVLKR